MKQIVPEVYVNDCAKALKFYQELFGGKIKNLQMSDELEMFKDYKGKVVHSELHVNSRCIFYFADIFDSKRKNAGNITLMLHMESKEEIERVYDILSKNGRVAMPLQKTFWNALHSIITDRFGVPWALNYVAD